MLWIDSREPETLRAAVTLALGPQLVRVSALDTGDYLIFDRDRCTLAVERKTIRDLLGSFRSGRLQKQLGRLTATDHYIPLLLIEGPFGLNDAGYLLLGRRVTGWKHAALQTWLYTVQARGVRVLWTPHARATADALRVLHARGQVQCLSGADPVPPPKAVGPPAKSA